MPSNASSDQPISLIVNVMDHGDHYEVKVRMAGGEEYATTRGPHLDVALNMAVPYMAYACEPDPFAGLLGDKHE